MSSELLGNLIIRKSDGKRVGYIGVIAMLNKKIMDETIKKFPPSAYLWVEYRNISRPKTKNVRY